MLWFNCSRIIPKELKWYKVIKGNWQWMLCIPCNRQRISIKSTFLKALHVLLILPYRAVLYFYVTDMTNNIWQETDWGEWKLTVKNLMGVHRVQENYSLEHTQASIQFSSCKEHRPYLQNRKLSEKVLHHVGQSSRTWNPNALLWSKVLMWLFVTWSGNTQYE